MSDNMFIQYVRYAWWLGWLFFSVYLFLCICTMYFIELSLVFLDVYHPVWFEWFTTPQSSSAYWCAWCINMHMVLTWRDPNRIKPLWLYVSVFFIVLLIALHLHDVSLITLLQTLVKCVKSHCKFSHALIWCKLLVMNTLGYDGQGSMFSGLIICQ